MTKSKSPLGPDVWNKLLMFDREFRKRDEVLSYRNVAEIFQVGLNIAQRWHYCLNHRHIIRNTLHRDSSAAGETVLVLNDIHIPYEDKLAVEAVLNYADPLQPDIIVLNGDVLDFYKISRFMKKPKNHDVCEELNQTKKFLTNLRERFPLAKIIYKEGNHEKRLEHYIISNAREIHSLIDDLLARKLDFEKLKIEYREDFFQLGKLWFLHGHEKPNGGDPEYVTNVIFKYVLDHFIVGHFHRSQEKIYRRIDGSSYWGGANGYLAGYTEYAPLNKWNQGFAVIKFGRNGTFNASLKVIHNGDIY